MENSSTLIKTHWYYINSCQVREHFPINNIFNIMLLRTCLVAFLLFVVVWRIIVIAKRKPDNFLFFVKALKSPHNCWLQFNTGIIEIRWKPSATNLTKEKSGKHREQWNLFASPDFQFERSYSLDEQCCKPKRNNLSLETRTYFAVLQQGKFQTIARTTLHWKALPWPWCEKRWN